MRRVVGLAVALDPRSGLQETLDGGAKTGLIGTALSHDRTTILGATGGFDPTAQHAVVTIPYAGGTPTTLVSGAFDADWNR